MKTDEIMKWITLYEKARHAEMQLRYPSSKRLDWLENRISRLQSKMIKEEQREKQRISA